MRAQKIKNLEQRVKILQLKREIELVNKGFLKKPRKREEPRLVESGLESLWGALRGAKVKVPKTDLAPVERRLEALEAKPLSIQDTQRLRVSTSPPLVIFLSLRELQQAWARQLMILSRGWALLIL